jgi:NAD-dependent SIR2 family protein deacetylase
MWIYTFHSIVLIPKCLSGEGIDTFRGSGGLWSGLIGSTMLLYGGTPFGWNLTPGFTWSMFVRQFYTPIAAAKPHEGYFALNDISKKMFKDEVHVITMNVDGLHQASGFSNSHVSEGM